MQSIDDASWPKIMLQKRNTGKTFTVFTGNHGHEVGVYDKDGKMKERHLEGAKTFLEQDLDTKEQSSPQGIEVNIQETPRSKEEFLRAMKAAQARGDVIILAYCNSIATLAKFDIDMRAGQFADITQKTIDSV